MYPSVVTECEKACMRRTTVPTSISWRFCCFLLWIARRAEKLAQTMNWANKTKQKRKKKSLSDLPLGLSRWHHKGERQPLKEKREKKKHRSLWKRLLIIHKPPVAPFLHSTSTESVVCHLLKKKKGGDESGVRKHKAALGLRSQTRKGNSQFVRVFRWENILGDGLDSRELLPSVSGFGSCPAVGTYTHKLQTTTWNPKGSICSLIPGDCNSLSWIEIVMQSSDVKTTTTADDVLQLSGEPSRQFPALSKRPCD